MKRLDGVKLPLDYFELDKELQDNFFGSMGEAAVELQDIAKALESEDMNWFKNNKGLASYYRQLANNLVASQQIVFNRNVFDDSSVDFN